MNAPAPDPSSDPLLPRDWAELSPLVDAVLDAALDQRAALMVELSGGHPERLLALQQLVADCERDIPLLSRPAAERFDQLLEDDPTGALPDLVGERYQVVRELGRGGMGRVYLARDLKHGRDVAIKVVRSELAASLGHDRFLREIAIAARLGHPNIVPLFDSGDANGTLYFVMRYEQGPSLRERLSREGPLPIGEAVSVLRDVARALLYAHTHGVVHRDVKPDNILMSGGAAVVADFGIAKALTAAHTDPRAAAISLAGAGIGTPEYMAPEQARGDPATDHRADIYSFGCLAYELLTGRPPFVAHLPQQVMAAHEGTLPHPLRLLRREVPDGINRLVNRCLEKRVAARPQSAAELLTVLEHPGVAGEPRREQRFSARVITLAFVVLAVILAGLATLR